MVVKFRVNAMRLTASLYRIAITGGYSGRGIESRTTFYPCKVPHRGLEHPMLYAQWNAVGSPGRCEPIFSSVPCERITLWLSVASTRDNFRFDVACERGSFLVSMGLLSARSLGGKDGGENGLSLRLVFGKAALTGVGGTRIFMRLGGC